MKRSVALFGGSFNPIHNGHIKIAKITYDVFKLDEVIFIPANISPLKSPDLCKNKNERYQMLEMALDEYCYFSISDFELAKGSKSLTIDTISYFLDKFPDYKFYFLMGEDSFLTIEAWNSFKRIFKTIDLIVYSRGPNNFNAYIKKISDFQKVSCSYRNTDAYKNKDNHFVYYMKQQKINISSSSIREQIDKIELSHNLMPGKVFEFVKKKKLY